MNERRNKMKKGEKNVTGKPLPGSSTSCNAKQDRVMDNISMSKKLNTRNVKKVSVRKTPTNKKTNKRNSNRGRRPMPSFTDLEKMFDYSNVTETIINKPESSNINSNAIQAESKTQETLTHLDSELNHCNVTNVISEVDRQIPLINTGSTPNSLNSNNTIEILSPNIKPIDRNEIIVIDDEEPQIVILTQERKRKKSISQNGSIIEHQILDFNHPQKIRRLSESSETCANKKDSDGSDSDDTIIYDLEGPPNISPLQISRRFSPLPSTSTDSVTISKNDKSFMNSLSESQDSTSVKICNDRFQDIIVIDDIDSKYSTQETQNPENDTEVRVEKHTQPQQESYFVNSDALKETNYNNSDIVNVDAIIAENEYILREYKTVEHLPTIIEVEPRQNNGQINTLVHVDLNSSTSNNQETRSVPRQRATNQNIMTQSQNFNIGDVNHRNKQRTSTSTSVSINTVNQITSRNSTVDISLQNTRPVNQITNREISDVASTLNCPICLENLRSKECASTICGHIFCMECIKRALKSTKRCPTCRKIVKGQGYHRLFL